MLTKSKVWTAWEEEVRKKKSEEQLAHERRVKEMSLQQEAMRREAGISK